MVNGIAKKDNLASVTGNENRLLILCFMLVPTKWISHFFMSILREGFLHTESGPIGLFIHQEFLMLASLTCDPIYSSFKRH